MAWRTGWDGSGYSAAVLTNGHPPNGAGGYQLEVTLRTRLPHRLSPETAHELVEATHKVCPYSNVVRGNVPVTLLIE